MLHFPALSYKEFFDKKFDLVKYIKDLNLKNVFEVKIKDLKLARRVEANEMMRAFGIPRLYTAPEVARGDSYDNTADIWSFGCIFY